MAVIQAEHLAREYVMGKNVIRAVDDISFTIQEGTYTMILGASGAGKSTVLNLLGGMDSPTSGSLRINGRDIARFNKRQLAEYRRNSIGFVFQFYNLMPNLTMRENVELASQICKDPLDAQETLELVGLGERSSNFPSQCSGGEQQRGAIARALAKNPAILLCDEPTGALDYKTGKQVLALLQNTCRETGRTVIVITHNSALTAMADRVIHIRNGQVAGVEVNENPTPVERIEW